MKNWNGFWSFLSRFLSIFCLCFFLFFGVCEAQKGHLSASVLQRSHHQKTSFVNAPASSDTTKPAKKYPDPHKVLFRSLMIPGWGQVINKQAYKVPIVYALIGGLIGYTIYETKQYHDYRAAYYNDNAKSSEDQRFGPTPAYLQNISASQLKKNRNSIHNRRDMMYIAILGAYALNALDAYIFANLRSFDVSKNLSVRTHIEPGIVAQTTPGITLSFNLFSHKK
jgi:hypothetical protein